MLHVNSTAKLCKHRDARSGVLDNGLAKTYGFPSEMPTACRLETSKSIAVTI